MPCTCGIHDPPELVAVLLFLELDVPVPIHVARTAIIPPEVAMLTVREPRFATWVCVPGCMSACGGVTVNSDVLLCQSYNGCASSGRAAMLKTFPLRYVPWYPL